MENELSTLIKLQEIETEVDSIRLLLSQLPQRLDKLDRELQEFEGEIEVEKERLNKLKQQYRAYESDAQMNLSQIEKSNEKLKFVKTNKEYQSSLKEIEDLQLIISKIEDEMINCLESMDDTEGDIAKKNKAYLDYSHKVNKEKKHLQQESDHGEKKLSQLEDDWKRISKMIDSDLLRKYQGVKEQVGRVTIVAVQNAVCQGCNLNIPPQMYNELQRFESLMFCPHCQRLIYPLAS